MNLFTATGSRSAKPALDRIDTLIGAKNILHGSIAASGTIVIEGLMYGDVTPPPASDNEKVEATTLHIKRGGKVDGQSIYADFIVVEGAIFAKSLQCKSLIVLETGTVRCEEIIYQNMSTKAGAKVLGNCKIAMKENESSETTTTSL